MTQILPNFVIHFKENYTTLHYTNFPKKENRDSVGTRLLCHGVLFTRKAIITDIYDKNYSWDFQSILLRFKLKKYWHFLRYTLRKVKRLFLNDH